MFLILKLNFKKIEPSTIIPQRPRQQHPTDLRAETTRATV